MRRILRPRKNDLEILQRGRRPVPITEDEMAMSPDFDCRVFDMHKPWPLYRAMLIERIQHVVAYRRGLGKIHVDGFWKESL